MTLIKGDVRLRIVRDADPCNPRDDDNLGTMYHWHPSSMLGDEQVAEPCDQAEYDELISDYGIVLPVFAHAAAFTFTLNTRGVTCEFDSGQVGFIGIMFDKVRKEFLIEPVTPIDDETRAKVVACLKAEVDRLSSYINGDVWGYILEQEVRCSCCENIEWEHVDSCYGYIGDAAEESIAAEIGNKETTATAWEART